MRLVMLPGLDGSGELFQPLLRVLPADLIPQVISYPPDRILSYDALVQLVHRVLPRNESFVMLGESFGGPLSLKVAAMPPPNLRALILSSTFVSNPLPAAFLWMAWLPRPLVPKILKRNIPDFLVRIYAAGMDAPQDLVDLFQAAKRNVDPHVLTARLQAVQEIDARAALTNCPVPLLCLQATKDRLILRTCQEEMRSIRPDMKMVKIDSPHFLLQRRSHDAVSAIEAFLNSIS